MSIKTPIRYDPKLKSIFDADGYFIAEAPPTQHRPAADTEQDALEMVQAVNTAAEIAELRDGIAHEHGGFKAETVEIAKGALALIAQLRSEVARTLPLSDWIPVSERLPDCKVRESYLATTRGGDVLAVWFSAKFQTWQGADVIAWQPLPAAYIPPAEGATEKLLSEIRAGRNVTMEDMNTVVRSDESLDREVPAAKETN